MTLVSMTGFSRASGAHGSWRWVWELKTVNAKGLDLRVRVPSGFDNVEAQGRAKLGATLARGTCYANLSAQKETTSAQIKINEQALNALRTAIAKLPADAAVGPATLDGLLNIRGIVEIAEAVDDEALMAEVATAMLASLDEAIAALVTMRKTEGQALKDVLSGKLSSIAKLTQAAETCPGRQPAAVRARLERSIAELAGASPALDPVRLHQEALVMAAKADIREELDRLVAHETAARELLADNAPIGRRLDFLAQELAREANTLCSKSNDTQLTSIGMDLRVQIEQFREQVQNIE